VIHLRAALCLVVILSWLQAGCLRDEPPSSQLPQADSAESTAPGPALDMAPTRVPMTTSPAPSVVLITLDTLRRDHLSLYGYDRPTSPFLDELAAESIVFERAISTSSWTKPSAVSLLTGLLPSEHGVHGKHRKAAAELVFLAEVLREHGFETAAFSANPFVSPVYGLDQGFSTFEFLGGRSAEDYADIRELITRARFWLNEQGDAAIFLYLHLMNVHGPYRAPPEYRQRFLQEPYTIFRFRSELWSDIARRHKVERRSEVTDAHLRDLIARYDGAIAYTDDTLRHFVDDLRTRGILDRTILVITSDHGEEMFEHGSFGHWQTLHAEQLQVPLLIRLPGGRSGGIRISEPASLLDVATTLLDLTGVLSTLPGTRVSRGVSLLDSLDTRAAADSPRLLLAELMHHGGTSTMAELWPYRMIDMVDAEGSALYRVDVDRARPSTSPTKSPRCWRISPRWHSTCRRPPGPRA
jgi:arylsulfatase